MSRENDIRKLIEINHRHLYKLNEQAAKFGVYVPPHVLLEIEDKETEIAALQKELATFVNANGQATNIVSDRGHEQIYSSFQSLPTMENLEIVDIAFQDDHPIVLDIKLRNTSSQVAFIKSVVMTIDSIWPLAPIFHTGALILPSANYDIEIPIKEVPYSVESSVSQAISPNGADRFTLTLMCPPHHVILAQLALFYDSDSKKLSSDNLIFARYGPSCSYPTMTTEELARMDTEASNNYTWEVSQWPEKRKVVVHNNAVREQIKSIAGIRNSRVQRLEAI